MEETRKDPSGDLRDGHAPRDDAVRLPLHQRANAFDLGLSVRSIVKSGPRLLHCEGSGNLDRARSRLYRNEFLQENMRLKALAEIYTMQSFALL